MKQLAPLTPLWVPILNGDRNDAYFLGLLRRVREINVLNKGLKVTST